MEKKYNYLIVGAGFAGATFARKAAEHGQKVLVIDRRDHIGGNAYDCYNNEDVLIHQYGPHIFHTNHQKVWNFLSEHTAWHYYQHRVVTSVDGQEVPMPINVKTINMLYGTSYTAENIHEFYKERKKDIPEIKTSEDVIVSQIGEELYEKFFKNYTKKQWGVYPSELDKLVTSRVPIRYNFDDRYFTDKYQAMPKNGYTALFKNILDHDNIEVLLSTAYNKVKDTKAFEKLIYCGPMDEFFECKYGKLPYRSLQFEFETIYAEKYQDAPVVNYPNDYDFTRITEYKYLTGQKSEVTTISREYSKADGDPYYPVPNNDTATLVAKYQEEINKLQNVYFLGRLAEYKYYNMDNVILRALDLFESLQNQS